MQALELDFAGNHLLLLPHKAIFFPEANSLLIADPHFGKSGHFRKSGIPVSGQVLFDDLKRLEEALEFSGATELYVLGDFFHAEPNKEWDIWCTWLEKAALSRVTLIPGNHDKAIMRLDFPMKMIKGPTITRLGGLNLCHDETTSSLPLLCGHVHPSVQLSGVGKLALKMPCFYMKKNTLILPAFGSFTGTYKIKAMRGERIFIPSANQVIEVKPV